MAGILLHSATKVPMSQGPAGNVSSLWLEGSGATSAGRGAKTGAQIAFANLPLTFEANQGQTDSHVKFLARGGRYTLFLTQDEAVLQLQPSLVSPSSAEHAAISSQHSTGKASVLRMKLVGADSRATISGTDLVSSRSNYLIGNDPAKWRGGVPQYGRVRYQQVYPGVDLVYYGNQGRLEYDFELAPGADPEEIRLRIEGANELRVNAKGDLLAQTAAGDVQLHAPQVYQNVGDQKRDVTSKFVLSAGNRVHFALGEYDRGRALVIDPVLNYSTYLGGTGDEGCAAAGIKAAVVPGCPGIAVDAGGNIYVAGATTSIDFPPAGTPLQAHSTGVPDVFIAKFSPNPSSIYSLVYSTYLGGTGSDISAGIAVDSSLNIYVAGNTSSTNFPVTPNGNQTTPPVGGSHGFVSVLNASGSALIYSTYVEGNGTDTITGLAIDTRANAYVTGTTTSTSVFPITPGAIQISSQSPANPQFFLTKLNTQPGSSSSLMYSTYFGSTLPGSGAFVQGGGVAVDPFGFAYITGGTNFLSSGSGGNFPILNAFQPCLDAPKAASCGSPAPTNPDAFVAKIDTTAAAGAQLRYSTYIGGIFGDVAYAIAVDGAGNAYIAGATDSADFPIASATSAFQASNASPPGGTDAFIAKFGTSGAPIPLSYSSYLGGAGNDIAYAIAVDQNQGAHLTGITNSPASATNTGFNVNAIQGSPSGLPDAFVALIQTTNAGQTGWYATYFGGSGADDGTGISSDASANTYVAGETTSTNFPLASPQFPSLRGPSDAFVSKIVPSTAGLTLTPSTSVASGSTIGIGNQVTFTYTIDNAGPDVATNLLFTDTLPVSGATFASASASPGSCTAVVNGTVTCSLGSLGVGTSGHPTSANVKINLTPTVAGTLSNSGTLQANGLPFQSASTSVPVTDFSVGVSPSTSVVVAGNSATYQAQVGVPTGQTNFFPNSVSLACSAGVPSAAACAFSTSPVTMTNTSAVTSTLTITTTARPVPTTAQRRSSRYWYAAMLPIPGLTFLGLGMGAGRRRIWVIAVFCLLAFALAGFQLACSSGSGTTTPPTGTPAGTYVITLTGTSGSASHATSLTLVVQ